MADASKPIPKGSRRCPVCSATMTLARKGTTEIDLCEEHGVWLDAGELEALVNRGSPRRERDEHHRRRKAVEIARHEGKVSGWLLGPLAFFFD